ncbi:MAG: divalent-cation tolerance protein CutA, partial [Brooklawnia sp.]|nr:divalent-cation tolerance protein CutA [Brooklawnia sp.]
HHVSEVLMMVKTRTALLDQLVEQVREMHVYDAPEIVALPIIGGSADYLNWVDAETRPVYR